MRTLWPTIVVSTLVLFALPACSTDEEPLPESLSSAYADLLGYRDTAKEIDSTGYSAGIDSVLQVHGYTRTSFAEAFEGIGTSADRVNAFFDSAASRLKPPTKSK